MRIIAGEFGGRPITPPQGRRTRPMLGRVRESLFSTLDNLVDDACVLDLFAGSGSLGLEALSRGARSVRFVERDRGALRVLRENVQSLQVESRVQIAQGDAFDRDLWHPKRAPAEREPWAGVIFLDPPYPRLQSLGPRRAVLGATLALHAEVLQFGGALVLHTHPRDVDREEFPADLDLERRVYGNTVLWYLWKPSSWASGTSLEPNANSL